MAVDGGFTNVTTLVGIQYDHYGDDFEITTEYQILTGGAAAGDYDGDGWVDLFVTRLDDTDILYRNMGATRGDMDSWFQAQSAAEIGINVVDRTNGAAWGDIDNDGDLDLYVSVIEGSRFYLYVNDGDGTFTEQGVLRGVALESDLDHNGYSVTFGDYDRDGWLDIHTCEWDIVNSDPASVNHSVLLRNRGKEAPGFYENVTLSAGVVIDHATEQYAFASSFSDLDGDGWPDLVIAGDFTTSRVYWNNGDGTFTDGTIEAGLNKGKNEMGSAIADFNKDGLLDWFATSTQHDNRMYLNRGDREFDEVASELGVENGEWGWGTQLFDFENDGDYDLLMTNGWHIFNEPLTKEQFATSSFFWTNDAGAMTLANPDQMGLRDQGEGKGLLTFDYDQDGDLDLFIVNNGDPPVLYRNDSNTGNDWLQIKLMGDRSNTRGIGARIQVTLDEGEGPQLFEMSGASHFLGQSEAIVQIGLGDHEDPIYSVRIDWPSGKTQVLNNVEVNQRLMVVEEPIFDYAKWLPDYFDANQQLIEALSSKDADPDRDGLSNLWEYALGLNPWSVDASAYSLQGADDEGDYRLTFSRVKTAEDLEIIFEYSSDLNSWYPIVGVEQVIASGAEREIVELAFTQPGPVFARIRLFTQP